VTIPAPRLRRQLRIVLADPERGRFAVWFNPVTREWMLPTVSMREQEGVRDAAARFLEDVGRELPVHVGSTVGWRSKGALTGMRLQERWLPIRLLTAPVPVTTFPAATTAGWHPFYGVAATEELGLAITLAQGYWEGWLPDGKVTLGE
jgi:hypothetical protein